MYLLTDAARRVARGPVAVCNPGNYKQIKGIIKKPAEKLPSINKPKFFLNVLAAEMYSIDLDGHGI